MYRSLWFACSTVVAKKYRGCCACVIVVPRRTSALAGFYYLYYQRHAVADPGGAQGGHAPLARKSGPIRCLTWKPRMHWGQNQDQALPFQPPKTWCSTLPADSPGLQGMEDQPPDLRSAPPAEGSRDEPPKDRRPEE